MSAPPRRPPLDPDATTPTVDVRLKLPEQEYNALWDDAQRARLSVGDLIRLQLLQVAARDPTPNK